MKATGMTRRLDELGRVVIPIEIRRTLNIDVRDPLEIFVEDEKIILQKYKASQACIVTGEVSSDNLKLADGKLILSREAAEDLISELKASLKK